MSDSPPDSPPIPWTRARKTRLAAGLGIWLLWPVAGLIYPLTSAAEIVLCPMLRWTGRPCLLCGLTRAWGAAARGEFDVAWSLHPLWPVSVVLVGGLSAMLIFDGLTGRSRTADAGGWVARHWPITAAAIVLLTAWRWGSGR